MTYMQRAAPLKPETQRIFDLGFSRSE